MNAKKQQTIEIIMKFSNNDYSEEDISQLEKNLNELGFQIPNDCKNIEELVFDKEFHIALHQFLTEDKTSDDTFFDMTEASEILYGEGHPLVDLEEKEQKDRHGEQIKTLYNIDIEKICKDYPNATLIEILKSINGSIDWEKVEDIVLTINEFLEDSSLKLHMSHAKKQQIMKFVQDTFDLEDTTKVGQDLWKFAGILTSALNTTNSCPLDWGFICDEYCNIRGSPINAKMTKCFRCKANFDECYTRFIYPWKQLQATIGRSIIELFHDGPMQWIYKSDIKMIWELIEVYLEIGYYVNLDE